jgi:hypothetical protein
VDQHTRLEPSQAYFHGAFLVFLDALGLGATAIGQSANNASELCSQFLSDQLKDLSAIDGKTNGTDEAMDTEDNNNEMFTFGGFSVPRGTSLCCVCLFQSYQKVKIALDIYMKNATDRPGKVTISRRPAIYTVIII